jgi:ribosome biogenesis GTPase
VTKIEGTASLVDVPGRGVHRCDLRAKIFRQLDVRLAVGDEVELVPDESQAGELRGVIEAVRPRRTRLRRPRAFKRDQVVCANIDQVFLVVAVLEPDYKRNFIDRVLVAVEREGLQGAIIFNKVDLADERYRKVVEGDANVYRRAGYPALLASAESGEGLDHLARALLGKITVFSGPSGVGKTSLLNAIQPGLGLRTNEVSESTGRGKHTTTAAELFKLDQGGYVADTPGVRAFGLWDVGPRELAECFHEIGDVAKGCRFRDCSHRHEPDCAVVRAVQSEEAGPDGEPLIDEERYDSYVKLRDELEAEEAARQAAKKR